MYNTYQEPLPQYQPIYTHNWQSALNNDTLATELSIPGTHDSAAYQTPHIGHKIFTSMVWKTQDEDIATQLVMGIRFFDVRVRCEEGEGISLCHGSVYLGEFQIVMKPIVQFLQKNSSQFVMLLFQKEQGKQNSKSSGAKILKQIQQFTKNKISLFQYDSNTVPRVQNLRGKIWLIQAYPGNHNRVDLPGQLQISTYCSTKILSDGRSYIIQNYWQGPEDRKKQAVLSVINCPHRQQLLRVNFVIQSNLPRFYASGYNKWLKKTIQEGNMKGVGVIVMDFPDGELIRMIIRSNF